jgi:signal transduction histidine kinase
LNEQLAIRKRESASRQRVLEAIGRFHASDASSGNIQDSLSAVAESAAWVLGEGWWALLYQAGNEGPWLLSRYGADGRGGSGRFMDPPPLAGPLGKIEGQGLLLGIAPWISDQLGETSNLQNLRVLALNGGSDYGTIALLVHDRPALPGGAPLEALTSTWGAAIAAATRHQGARRLGERLAQANRLIASQQDHLLRSQSMARLGEMAAGAAHEMNNPLAIISGRAQLLNMRLTDDKLRQDASVIWQQCTRLSDLISSLRLLSDPPRPQLARASVRDTLEAAIHAAKQKMPDAPAARVSGLETVPFLVTDSQQLSTVVCELLLNAYQAQPRNAVKITTSVDPLTDRWIMTVTDDGIGMDPLTLEHAFDPFFSVKPAGRQTGMGLPRARRLIEGLDGTVELSSQKDKGTIATIALPLKIAMADEGIGSSRRTREGDRREVITPV